ncbi:hypothetical protein HZS_5118 [Henneguya salminicola]|nr:hypothetical protein HZS_5118 [Henneguya salminicola]
MIFMNIKYPKKINKRIYSIDKNTSSDYFYIRVLALLWEKGATNNYNHISGDKLYRYDHYHIFKSENL